MNSDDYRSDADHDRARMTQAEKILADLREERKTRINLLCQQCSGTMPVERRKPGIEYCSPTCDHIAAFRGQPGDIAYAPRNAQEREEHHRELRKRRATRGKP